MFICGVDEQWDAFADFVDYEFGGWYRKICSEYGWPEVKESDYRPAQQEEIQEVRELLEEIAARIPHRSKRGRGGFNAAKRGK